MGFFVTDGWKGCESIMNIKGMLIDLDGTLYRGNEVIPDAPLFIETLRRNSIPFLFLTNNSTRKPEQVALHLRELGISAYPEEVFTSSMAAARYLAHEEHVQKVYLIGEEGLFAAIQESGKEIVSGENVNEVEAVVVGLDRHLTYEKLARACLAIRRGAKFISTNSDIALPTERGFLPGSGAIAALIRTSTERVPVTLGKPEKLMIQYALEQLKSPPEETLLVGDNLQTDILAGVRMGIKTVMIYTGVSTPEHVARSEIKPDYTYSTLTDFMKEMFNGG
jgi:4-nitrophenyl phosphatase